VPDSSPEEALEHLRALARAGDEIAVIVADQWMPGMSGVEFLSAASLSSLRVP
jgi:hypothetical protein